MRKLILCSSLLLLNSCFTPAEDRALMNLDVGKSCAGDVCFEVEEGLASIREIEPGLVTLWAQAPVLTINVSCGNDAQEEWKLRLMNGMPVSRLFINGTRVDSRLYEWRETKFKTRFEWALAIPRNAGHTLTIMPDEPGNESSTISFAVMGDVQGAIDDVGDIFRAINRETGISFAASVGDNLSGQNNDEHGNFQDMLTLLEVPYYATIGNHELGLDPELWFEYFGRSSFSYTYLDSCFTFADSANASIDPIVYGWMDEWFDECAGAVHFFFTHYTPIDPVGGRNGSFASRSEALMLISELAAGGIDAVFSGHIHSYYKFSYAGIPFYISGGGGAVPEEFDGIGRHFLKVTADRSGAQKPVIKKIEVD